MTTIIAILTLALLGMIATGVYLHYQPLRPEQAGRWFKPTVFSNLALFFVAQAVAVFLGVSDALAAA